MEIIPNHDDSCFSLQVSDRAEAAHKVAVRVPRVRLPGIYAHHDALVSQLARLPRPDADLGYADIVRDHQNLLSLPSRVFSAFLTERRGEEGAVIQLD